MSGRRNGGTAKAMIAVLVCAAVLLLLWFTRGVKVPNVIVTGVTEEVQAKVLASCGIVTGETALSSVNEESLRRNLQGLGDCELISFSKEFDGSVRLQMRTRVARAKISTAGKMLIIDGDAQVMEESRGNLDASLLEVRGLRITQSPVGRELQCEDQNQVLVLRKLIASLDETGLYSRVTEADLGDLDRMYMLTVDGVRIEIGDDSILSDKFRRAKDMLEVMPGEGLYGGTVNVTMEKDVIYTAD